MKCPKCGGDLQPVVQDNIEVDRCAQCGGMWFDRMEADRLRKVKGSATAIDTGDARLGAELNQQGKIECPRCHTQMIRMVDLEQPHIWYESCSVCYGKWFDAGEFKDLQQESIVDFFRGLFARERD
jgi:Zn-finger nucleic acid-binding protein